ncbi:MAG: hypothetical protein H6737_04865 [Alphaproteobacteria bacterium]|nr:hypothetical protein [Alphaproteobacteria bacterium]
MDWVGVGIGFVVGSLVAGGLALVALRSRTPAPLPAPPALPPPPPPEPHDPADDVTLVPSEPEPTDRARQIPGVVVLVGTEGEVSWASAMAEAIFGPGLEGLPFERVLPDWEALDTHRAERIEAPNGAAVGEVWHLDATTLGGLTVPVRVRRASAGEGWWVVLRDASGDQKQLERLTKANSRLQVARDEAIRDSRVKTAYLGRVAQALRTPLTAIVGYGELISEELEDRGLDELMGDIAKINGAAATLETILQTVLDWSEVESGKMAVAPETFDLGDVVRDAVAASRARVEGAGSTLVVDVPEGVRVHGDTRRVGQIVRHLLQNAAEHCENGTITVRLAREGERGAVSVSDTGEGIGGGELEELFVDFAQRQGEQTSGTGLSLLLAHTFAGMMGGELRVESPPGAGATFTLSLSAVDENEYAPPMMV